MVLGVYHFSSSSDQYTTEDDVLTTARQHEIAEVVNLLTCFRPTKIAVEHLQTDQAWLDHEFAEYVKDDRALPSNEVYQLGFRIARQLGHQKLYAVDIHNEESDLDIGRVFEYAERDCPILFQQINSVAQEFVVELQSRIRSESVRQVLQWMNDPAMLRISHQPYLTMTQLGAETSRIGLRWVSRWYERNLVIYSNILNFTTSDDDRWLVIYGQGHARLLGQFLSDSRGVKIVPVSEYL
ncbi:DUF5694 domain-containing protein [Sulfoacidibacillus ferrooxidans]|nr:DUF5694 domain-containing protein [Sulfoacidibacillus ferrooxidans]